MSPLPSNRLRFVCRMVRGWAARGGDPETNRAGSHHIARCADCSEFFAAGRSLDFALKRDATRLSASVPDGLEQRIAQAVRRSRSTSAVTLDSSRSDRRRTFSVISFAAAAAAVALAVFVLQKPSVPPQTGPIATAYVSPRAEVEPPSNPLWNTGTPSASALLTRNPLEEEAAAVYSDARSAVRFLAMNFLPGAAESSPRRANGG